MFKDFAVYTNNNGVMDPDPAVSYIRAGSQLVSGGVGNAWTRPYLSFVPDRDSKYMVPAARVLTPDASTLNFEHLTAQHFTKWQVEIGATSGVPSDYSPARAVQVVVKPDRLNLLTNPSFETNLTGWTCWQGTGGNATVTRPTTGGLTGTAHARASWTVASSANGAFYWDSAQGAVTAGAVLTGSIYVRSSSPRPMYAQFEWFDGAGASVGTPAQGATGNVETESWTRLSVTGTAPVGATKVRFLAWTTGAVPINVWIDFDGALIERGATLGDYFDGSFGDDYLWETGGTAHASRSYYYENRLDRSEALRRALRDTVPLGIEVSESQFGVFTD